MLKTACLLSKIGADTAENERHFAENLPKIGNYSPGNCRLAVHGERTPSAMSVFFFVLLAFGDKVDPRSTLVRMFWGSAKLVLYLSQS